MPSWFNDKSFATLTPKVRAWVNRYVPQVQKSLFGRMWDAPWSNWGPHYARQYARLKIGNLFWPTGASRFGVYHGVIDNDTVDAWRADCLDQVDGFVSRTPGLFQMNDKVHSPILATMYMMPPVPLSFYSPPDIDDVPLYLVTLVDERFFWWYHSSSNLIDTPKDDWDALFEYFRTTLGISSARWSFMGASKDYFFPGDFLAQAAHIPLPILMDAAAYSIGQRFTLDFNPPIGSGKIQILRFKDSKANRDDETNGLANKNAISGGKISMSADPASEGEDAGLLLPDRIKVSFPLFDPDDLSVDRGRKAFTRNTFEVSADFNTYLLDGEITFWDTARAFSDGSSDVHLQKITNQIAYDYLYHESEANVDLTLAGIVYLLPCGLYDSVEYMEYIDDDSQITPAETSEEGYLVKEDKEIRIGYTRITRWEIGQRPFLLHHSIDEYGLLGSGSGPFDVGSQPPAQHCQTYTIICQDGSTQTVIICQGDVTSSSHPASGGDNNGLIIDPPELIGTGGSGGTMGSS